MSEPRVRAAYFDASGAALGIATGRLRDIWANIPAGGQGRLLPASVAVPSAIPDAASLEALPPLPDASE